MVMSFDLFLHQEYWELMAFPAVFSQALLQILIQQMVCRSRIPSDDDNEEVGKFQIGFLWAVYIGF